MSRIQPVDPAAAVPAPPPWMPAPPPVEVVPEPPVEPPPVEEPPPEDPADVWASTATLEPVALEPHVHGALLALSLHRRVPLRSMVEWLASVLCERIEPMVQDIRPNARFYAVPPGLPTVEITPQVAARLMRLGQQIGRTTAELLSDSFNVLAPWLRTLKLPTADLFRMSYISAVERAKTVRKAA